MMLRSKTLKLFTLPLLLLALVTCAPAQHAQHQPGQHNKPADEKGAAGDKHKHEVDERGERAMGFSQTKTTHHFTLHADGGSIQVEANDAADAESRARVREHLSQVAKSFAEGDFAKPKEVHAQAPPGVETMRRLRASIKYEYSETERGARVRISTADAEALAAVHAFLKFQIEDHATGDPTHVVEPH
jgi:hypothetical protein